MTGGAQGIGKCIAEELRKQGALIEVIDKQEGLGCLTKLLVKIVKNRKAKKSSFSIPNFTIVVAI